MLEIDLEVAGVCLTAGIFLIAFLQFIRSRGEQSEVGSGREGDVEIRAVPRQPYENGVFSGGSIKVSVANFTDSSSVKFDKYWLAPLRNLPNAGHTPDAYQLIRPHEEVEDAVRFFEKDIAREARKRGYSGTIDLTPTAVDTKNQEFEGEVIEFNVDQTYRKETVR